LFWAKGRGLPATLLPWPPRTTWQAGWLARDERGQGGECREAKIPYLYIV